MVMMRGRRRRRQQAARGQGASARGTQKAKVGGWRWDLQMRP
jgi:hypothetical protein